MRGLETESQDMAGILKHHLNSRRESGVKENNISRTLDLNPQIENPLPERDLNAIGFELLQLKEALSQAQQVIAIAGDWWRSWNRHMVNSTSTRLSCLVVLIF